VAEIDIEVTLNTTKQPLNGKSNLEVEIIDYLIYFRESQQSTDKPSTEGPHKSLTKAARPLMMIISDDVYMSTWKVP
jgi:hypothetical protein